jgi:hypothetical protein
VVSFNVHVPVSYVVDPMRTVRCAPYIEACDRLSIYSTSELRARLVSAQGYGDDDGKVRGARANQLCPLPSSSIADRQL